MLSAYIGFGFFTPTEDETIKFPESQDYDIVRQFPLLDMRFSGIGPYDRQVILVKSSIQSSYPSAELLTNSFFVSNKEVDELSACKQALGKLYAEYGYTGESYKFSHVDWWLFATYVNHKLGG